MLLPEVMNMNRLFFRKKAFALLLCCALLLSGCEGVGKSAASIPEIPKKLSRNDDGVPMLKVYNTATEDVEEMDIETYIMGVIAGEMKNTWPEEALKAQAILARTFTMRFVSGKDSAYKGADISTDVQEAQAYSAEDINEAVREAVNDTRGIVMAADGEFPYAWFHAHSGGKTELPSKALEYDSDPAYLTIVESPDSASAPEDVQSWRAEFSAEQVLQACRDAGTEIESLESIEIGERGESGRAVTLQVNGKAVSAPSFRIHIGAQKLKSTLIDTIETEGDSVVFTGRGYGHGVGMSQWGAYQMAQAGKSAEEIVHHYFTGVELVELW